MWIMTRDGFFSVVRNRYAEGKVIIRARLVEHLESLRVRNPVTTFEIVRSGDSDYRYRAMITHEQFQDIARWMAEDVDYDNFKTEVGKGDEMPVGKAYSAFLHKVWVLGHDMQSKIVKLARKASE